MRIENENNKIGIPASFTTVDYVGKKIGHYVKISRFAVMTDSSLRCNIGHYQKIGRYFKIGLYAITTDRSL